MPRRKKKIEKILIKQSKFLIAGVDEVGRGALAGPVVAGVVLFDVEILKRRDYYFADEVKDSKLLSAQKRDKVYQKIINLGCTSFAGVSNKKIDKINILQATRLAMKNAVLALPRVPEIILIDGNIRLDLDIEQISIIGGDRTCFSISAASIVAKVTRDRIMDSMHKKFAVYNFKKNKGYGTQEHISALRRFGASSIHRKSFSPVNEVFIFEKKR